MCQTILLLSIIFSVNDMAACVSQPALEENAALAGLRRMGEPGVVYYIEGDSPNVTQAISAGTIHINKTNSDCVHSRLGHLHDRATATMQRHSMLDGLHDIDMSRKRGRTKCSDDGCLHGKMHKTRIAQESGRRPRAPGSDLSCDIGSPMPVRALGGYHYFCLLKDLYTLCRFIFFY